MAAQKTFCLAPPQGSNLHESQQVSSTPSSPPSTAYCTTGTWCSKSGSARSITVHADYDHALRAALEGPAEQEVVAGLPSDTTCQMFSMYPTSQSKPAKTSDANWWCPYCLERAGRFQKSSDMWKHVDNFHEKGQVWKCKHAGCKLYFCHQDDYDTHHEKQHESCAKHCYSIRAAAIGTIACGMEGCNAVFCGTTGRGKSGNAKLGARKHIAQHMKEGLGLASWDYSTMIRNLLRQPGVLNAWMSLIKSKGFDKFCWHEFFWTQRNPDLIKFQLETQLFGDLEGLVLKVFENARRIWPANGRVAPPLTLSYTLTPMLDPLLTVDPAQVKAGPTIFRTATSPAGVHSTTAAAAGDTSSSSRGTASSLSRNRPPKASPTTSSAVATLSLNHRLPRSPLPDIPTTMEPEQYSSFSFPSLSPDVAKDSNVLDKHQQPEAANDMIFCLPDQQPLSPSIPLGSPPSQFRHIADASVSTMTLSHKELHDYGPNLPTSCTDTDMSCDEDVPPRSDHWSAAEPDYGSYNSSVNANRLFEW